MTNPEIPPPDTGSTSTLERVKSTLTEKDNPAHSILAIIVMTVLFIVAYDIVNESPAELAKRVGEGQPANTTPAPEQSNDYTVPVIGDRQAAELSASEAQGACVWMARDEGMEPRNSPPPINRVDGGWVWTDFSRDGSQSWSCVLKDEGIHLLKTPPGMTID